MASGRAGGDPRNDAGRAIADGTGTSLGVCLALRLFDERELGVIRDVR